MEPTSLLARYSAISVDHDYTLLKGQPLSQLPDTFWYIPSLPACNELVFFFLSNQRLDYILSYLSYVVSYLCILPYSSLDLCLVLCMLPPLMSVV